MGRIERMLYALADMKLVLAQRLAAQLERFGNTAEIARRSGLQPSSIRKYAAGRNVPTALNLAAIADALGCSTDFLLGRIDAPDGHAWGDPVESDRDRDIRRLGTWLAGLPKAARAAAMAAGAAARDPDIAKDLLQRADPEHEPARTPRKRKRSGTR